MVEARRTISRSQMYFCVRGVKYYGEPTLLWFRWTVCIGDLSKIQEWKGSTLMRLQEKTWHKRLWKWIWTRWAPGHSRDGSCFLIEKITQVEERTRYSWQRDDAGQVLISGKQRLVWKFSWKAAFGQDERWELFSFPTLSLNNELSILWYLILWYRTCCGGC